MVKETAQSVKAEKDKLKEKSQEIYSGLQHLRDEVKTKRGGSHENLGEAIKSSCACLSESHDEFRKICWRQDGCFEKSLSTLSLSVENISTSIYQLQDHSYSYNVKLVGYPELKPRESAAETWQLCLQIVNIMGAEVQL